MTSLIGSVGKCQKGKGSPTGTLRYLSSFGLSPKGVGAWHVLKPSGSSLLFRVSQSHVLSKIGGACGQGSPNTIESQGVDS